MTFNSTTDDIVLPVASPIGDGLYRITTATATYLVHRVDARAYGRRSGYRWITTPDTPDASPFGDVLDHSTTLRFARINVFMRENGR